jgi:hypothetical protein
MTDTTDRVAQLPIIDIPFTVKFHIEVRAPLRLQLDHAPPLTNIYARAFRVYVTATAKYATALDTAKCKL